MGKKYSQVLTTNISQRDQKATSTSELLPGWFLNSRLKRKATALLARKSDRPLRNQQSRLVARCQRIESALRARAGKKVAA